MEEQGYGTHNMELSRQLAPTDSTKSAQIVDRYCYATVVFSAGESLPHCQQDQWRMRGHSQRRGGLLAKGSLCPDCWKTHHGRNS